MATESASEMIASALLEGRFDDCATLAPNDFLRALNSARLLNEEFDFEAGLRWAVARGWSYEDFRELSVAELGALWASGAFGEEAVREVLARDGPRSRHFYPHPASLDTPARLRLASLWATKSTASLLWPLTKGFAIVGSAIPWAQGSDQVLGKPLEADWLPGDLDLYYTGEEPKGLDGADLARFYLDLLALQPSAPSALSVEVCEAWVKFPGGVQVIRPRHDGLVGLLWRGADFTLTTQALTLDGFLTTPPARLGIPVIYDEDADGPEGVEARRARIAKYRSRYPDLQVVPAPAGYQDPYAKGREVTVYRLA